MSVASKETAARAAEQLNGDDSGKSSARRDLVADAIMEQAAELFADRGFQGTSIRNIAEAMGMSRPAVYHYFSSKEALLEELIEGITGRIVELLREIRADPELDPSEKLSRAVSGVVLRVAERPAHMRLLAANERSLPEELAQTHASARREATEHLQAIIAEGVDAGEFRPVNIRIAAFAIFGMCDWVAWWFRPGAGATEQEIANEMSSLAVKGLAKSKARRGADGIAQAIGLLREDLDHLERLVPAKQRRG